MSNIEQIKNRLSNVIENLKETTEKDPWFEEERLLRVLDVEDLHRHRKAIEDTQPAKALEKIVEAMKQTTVVPTEDEKALAIERENKRIELFERQVVAQEKLADAMMKIASKGHGVIS